MHEKRNIKKFGLIFDRAEDKARTACARQDVLHACICCPEYTKPPQ